jgi:hypothetical protein
LFFIFSYAARDTYTLKHSYLGEIKTINSTILHQRNSAKPPPFPIKSEENNESIDSTPNPLKPH